MLFKYNEPNCPVSVEFHNNGCGFKIEHDPAQDVYFINSTSYYTIAELEQIQEAIEYVLDDIAK